MISLFHTLITRRKNLNESFRMKFGDISYHTKMSQLTSSNLGELLELKSVDEFNGDNSYRSVIHQIDHKFNTG